MKSKLLSEETRKVLLASFAELPYTVLWKFEQEDLPGKPDNVVISKWFPQEDIFSKWWLPNVLVDRLTVYIILGHPNIKLFITQGGLQSVEEAISSYIPMIGIPFMADQPFNVQKIVQKGMGLSLDHKTLEKDSFKKAILEIMNNPR